MSYKFFWRYFKILIVVALSANISLPVRAQSLTESKDIIPSLLNNPAMVGQKVTLTGNILKKYRDEGGHSDYILTDGVNEIIIELDEVDFEYDPEDTFKISGTVILETDAEYQDKSVPRKIEIQVKSIEKITDPSNLSE